MSNVAEYQPPQVPVNGSVQTSDAGAIIQMIERAARDTSVDIEKFERLMAMKERVEADAARRAFNEALAAAQAEIPHVYRDRENNHTRSRYATLEGILEKITPIITKHGFSISYGMADSPLLNHYRVTCTVSRGGHSQDYHADLPADAAGSQGKSNKTAIQAFGSTVTYGRRYLVMMIFNVALKNDPDDDDGNRVPVQDAYADDQPELLTDEQLTELRELMEAVDADPVKFCAFMKFKSLDTIPAPAFKRAMDELKAFGKRTGSIR